jgi:glycolate oxidase
MGAERERVQELALPFERALGPSKVRTDLATRAAHAGDESGHADVVPELVVVAESAADVRVALRVAHEARVPLTPRGAGTGKSGGCIPVCGGAVLSLVGLGALVEIDRDELVAVVEPGLVLGELVAAVEREGLFYPPDPNSLAECTMGGTIAENAAGPRAFKYGPTRDWVLGLEASFVGGEHTFTGRRTAKGVTGYDVTSLLVGSEGTLAVVERAFLKLAPLPEAVVTLLVLFASVTDASLAVSAVLGARVRPRCLELFDHATLEAVRRAGLSVRADAGAMLLIELDGPQAGALREGERVGEVLAPRALEVRLARDAREAEELWAARRLLSRATRAMAKKKLSEDVVVPRRHLASLVREAELIAEATGIRTLSYGHAGDGNLHVNFLWDDDEQEARVPLAIERLFRAVLALGGTLTGEHGVGLTKRAFLALEHSETLLALERRLKASFDPEGLLNPGKIFPRSHAAC